MPISREDVCNGFRFILGREPSDADIAAHTPLADIAQLRNTLMRSAEFRTMGIREGNFIDSHPDVPKENDVLDKFMTPDVRAATDRLTSHEPWNRGQFNSLAADVLAHATLTARYWSFHNERFRELLNHVDFLIRRVNSDAPSLLEVGGSVFSKLLHAAFPRARIDILQHPVRRLPFQPRRFLYIDLETIRGTVDLGVEARYDVIVFSEVLEHLLANPVVVLRFLLRQLRPGGFILLTTPNLFDAANLERIEHRRNPFPVYPEKPNPARSNQFGRDVSHHVRLYCMSELLQFSRQAGGRVSAFRFSPCWDNPANLAELPANLRKNLVVVMQERAVTGAAPT